jgi:hypothetical protein
VLKIQNQALRDQNPNWKEWWQTMQKLIDKQVQKKMEITYVNEQIN